MAGFGSMKGMKADRSLLKGNGGGKYNNFDTSYITDFKVSKSNKKLTYKRATKLQLIKIRKKLQIEQKETNKRKVIAFAFSVFVVVVLAYFIFS